MSGSEAGELQHIERGLLADDPAFLSAFDAAAAELAGPRRVVASPGPVVTAVDGSPASMAAVRWAARYAEHVDADLRIVHAFRWPAFPDQFGVVDTCAHDASRGAHDLVRAAAELARGVSPAIRVDGRVVDGGVGPVLRRHATEAGLLVLGRAHLTATRGVLRLSTAAGVTSRIRCAVTVVPAPRVELDASRCTGLVVVCQDGIAADVPALQLAFELAEHEGGGLQAMCSPGSERRVRNRIATVRRDFPSVQVVRTTATGDPFDTLLRASAGAAAVVLDREDATLTAARRGRGCRRLLNASSCPVVFTARR